MIHVWQLLCKIGSPSPTDPLSIISFCHQHIVVSALNTVTLGLIDGPLRGALNMMYMKLGITESQVKTWVKNNPGKR